MSVQEIEKRMEWYEKSFPIPQNYELNRVDPLDVICSVFDKISSDFFLCERELVCRCKNRECVCDSDECSPIISQLLTLGSNTYVIFKFCVEGGKKFSQKKIWRFFCLGDDQEETVILDINIPQRKVKMGGYTFASESGLRIKDGVLEFRVDYMQFE